MLVCELVLVKPHEPRALAGRTFLLIPSSWRTPSLLGTLQNVLSELFVPQGSLKEYASADCIQANLTFAFHFSQFKSHT